MRDELDRLLASELPAVAPLPARDCYIYGAGNVGREIASALRQRGHRVRAFIDRRALGTVDELEVHPPDPAVLAALARDGSTAVLGVFNFTVDPYPIITLLKDAGFERVVTLHELQELLDLDPHFWLTHRRYLPDHADRVRATWQLLGDDTSRAVFLDVVRLRVTADLGLLREPMWGRQYLADDLPRPPSPVRFVDGGAFTGDTLEFLLDEGLRFDAVAAFEPDAANFATLRETAGRLGDRLGAVSLWPCGLSQSTMAATFRSGQGAASAVASDGDVHVQLVALDDVLPAFAPTYIKLDIEGHEMAALAGAHATLQRHQPWVAACLYHRPDDLWEIPLRLHELLPGHRLAVRYHTYQAFELVAYAYRD
jgi:FkbM family methyltransferase